jgi:hypothetical protein
MKADSVNVILQKLEEFGKGKYVFIRSVNDNIKIYRDTINKMQLRLETSGLKDSIWISSFNLAMYNTDPPMPTDLLQSFFKKLVKPMYKTCQIIFENDMIIKTKKIEVVYSESRGDATLDRILIH